MNLKTTSFNQRNWTVFLVVSILVGIAVRLNIISQDFSEILSRYGSDDLFYFTELAKNFRYGLGITFDGEHLTNGVQPLWFLLLLPVAQLFEDPLFALRSVLCLITLLTVIIALGFPKVLELIEPKYGYPIGTIAGAIWILHPKILQVTFEGTEAALAALAWLVSLYAWQKSQSSKKYYVLGIVFGLGVLARIDHLILAGFLFLFPRTHFRNYLRKATQIAPGFILVLTPWLIMSFLSTGNLFPDSGGVKRFHFLRFLALQNDFNVSEVGELSLPAQQLLSAMKNGFSNARILVFAESTYSFSILLSVIGLLLLVLQRTFNQTKQLAYKLAPALLASVAIFSVYAIYIQFMRSWYLIPFFVLGVPLLSALVFDALSRLKLNAGKKQIITFLGIWALLVCTNLEANHKPRKGVGSHYFESLQFVETNTPEGSKIGAFNSGLAGAILSPNRTVVNLDGVVNNSAKKALSEFRLTEYVHHNSIDYILDYNKSIEFYYDIGTSGGMNTLTLVSEFEPTEKNRLTVGLWKVTSAIENE